MITVRELGPDDWETWRDLRLAALAEAPTRSTAGSPTGSARASRNGATGWPRPVGTWWSRSAADPPGRSWPSCRTTTASPTSSPSGSPARARGDAATALVDAVLDRAAGWGARTLALHVVVGNDRAAAFYRRLGFVDRGVVERPDGISETRMDRPVGRPVPRC